MTNQHLRPQHRQYPDTGASLILAIGFVLVIGLVSGGLISLATSGLSNRSTLQVVRNRQYAADGAIADAIAAARTRSCSAVESAAGTGDGNEPTRIKLNTIDIRVDWVNDCSGTIQSSNGTTVTLRNVTFSACLDTRATCDASKVIIRAQVNYQQQLAGGPVTKTYVLSWSVLQ